jgi:spoIIIJ-associated protein
VTNAQQPDPEVSEATEEQATVVVTRFCRDVIARLGFELTAEASAAETSILVNLTGQDRSYLLSNTASLLNSIEYLANKVFRTGKEARITSITLDSDNYRRHRESELTLLAEMAAKKVIAQRKALTLQPMTPRERRIVHLALVGVEGVRSQSEGEGDNRSVTIHPA